MHRTKSDGDRVLGIMQPYFFPYIGYFQLVAAVDRFILYDRVNYRKSGWVNRNRILELGKQPIYFRVPLVDPSPHRRICEIRIDNSIPWKDTIRKLLLRNYCKSPHFDEVFQIVEASLTSEVEYLAELNSLTVRMVANYLDLSTEIISDASAYESIEQEVRNESSETRVFYARRMALDDRKTVRIIRLCQREHARTYVNAIGGQALYDRDAFARNEIDLKFVSTLSHSYRQSSREFFPNLSIIDVLMNCGKEGAKSLLSRYELI